MGLMSKAQRAGRWSQVAHEMGMRLLSDAMGFELTLSRWSLPPSKTKSLGALRQAVGTVTASTRAVLSIARRFLRGEQDVIVERERAEAS